MVEGEELLVEPTFPLRFPTKLKLNKLTCTISPWLSYETLLECDVYVLLHVWISWVCNLHSTSLSSPPLTLRYKSYYFSLLQDWILSFTSDKTKVLKLNVLINFFENERACFSSFPSKQLRYCRRGRTYIVVSKYSR